MAISSNPASHTSSPIILGFDDAYVALGASGATDSYMTFDGTDLLFYDSNYGAEISLSTLAAGGATTLDAAFDGGKVIDGASSSGTAMKVGYTSASNFNLSLYHDGTDMYMAANAGDLKISAAGGDVDFSNENLTTQGTINIAADNINLTLGASGATDSYIMFDGSGNLTFYDSNVGATVTLSDMAGSNLNGPTVTGDMTVSDGKIVQTDTDDEIAYAVTSSSTTNDAVRVTANSTSSGAVIASYATDATLAGGGFYFRAYGGAANVFTVARYGATTIAGTAAGTDALTLTAGDITLTSGDVVLTDGTLTATTTTGTDGSKISKNVADSTNPALEVEQDHASGGIALLVDQDATGDVDAVSITNAGTGYAVTTTAGAAGGEGYEFVAAASGTGVAFRGDGSTGSWIGANDVGMIDLDTDGALAAGANLLRLDCTGTNAQNSFVAEILSSGNIAGATDGMCLNIVESGAAAATSYAVRIASTSNEALHVDTGLSLFDERVTITLADNTGPALAITNPDTTGNTNAVTVAPSGSGAGIAISPQETDTQGLLITTVQASTVPLLDLDLTTGTGWIGGATTGAIDVTADGAIVADGTLLRLASSGQPAAANDGVCLEIVESGAAQATSYAMRIASTNNEALHVDAGTVLVDETLAATGGIITVYSENDVTDPPTQAEMDTAFGAGAEAKNGMLGVINDANGGANVWLCVCADGAWYYAAKLTIGA